MDGSLEEISRLIDFFSLHREKNIKCAGFAGRLFSSLDKQRLADQQQRPASQKL